MYNRWWPRGQIENPGSRAYVRFTASSDGALTARCLQEASVLPDRVHQEAAPGDERSGGLATGMEVSFVTLRPSWFRQPCLMGSVN